MLIPLDCNRLHRTDVDQYRESHLNVRVDYGRLYHHDGDHHRWTKLVALGVVPYYTGDLLLVVFACCGLGEIPFLSKRKETVRAQTEQCPSMMTPPVMTVPMARSMTMMPIPRPVPTVPMVSSYTVGIAQGSVTGYKDVSTDTEHV